MEESAGAGVACLIRVIGHEKGLKDLDGFLERWIASLVVFRGEAIAPFYFVLTKKKSDARLTVPWHTIASAQEISICVVIGNPSPWRSVCLYSST